MRYRYQLPSTVKVRGGRLEEFKQDGAIASVRLADGRQFSGVLIVSPRFVAAVRGHDRLPFSLEEVEEVFQTPEDLRMRSGSDWTFFQEEE